MTVYPQSACVSSEPAPPTAPAHLSPHCYKRNLSNLDIKLCSSRLKSTNSYLQIFSNSLVQIDPLSSTPPSTRELPPECRWATTALSSNTKVQSSGRAPTLTTNIISLLIGPTPINMIACWTANPHDKMTPLIPHRGRPFTPVMHQYRFYQYYRYQYFVLHLFSVTDSNSDTPFSCINL